MKRNFKKWLEFRLDERDKNPFGIQRQRPGGGGYGMVSNRSQLWGPSAEFGHDFDTMQKPQDKLAPAVLGGIGGELAKATGIDTSPAGHFDATEPFRVKEDSIEFMIMLPLQLPIEGNYRQPDLQYIEKAIQSKENGGQNSAETINDTLDQNHKIPENAQEMQQAIYYVKKVMNYLAERQMRKNGHWEKYDWDHRKEEIRDNQNYLVGRFSVPRVKEGKMWPKTFKPSYHPDMDPTDPNNLNPDGSFSDPNDPIS